jgi:hypothetical protein
MYKPAGNKEVLYFDFSRSVGDTVSTTALGSDTMDVVLTSTGVATYFGTSRRIWTFYVNQARHTLDDEYSVTVADGIGIVYDRPDFGDPLSLVGAIVNGVRYGTILVAPNLPQGHPSAFKVMQNYPNPFNPSTVIEYELPTGGLASLRVFDALGREVRAVEIGRQSAGVHSVGFNAEDLPSGVYFYRLQAGYFVQTRKMVLLK